MTNTPRHMYLSGMDMEEVNRSEGMLVGCFDFLDTSTILMMISVNYDSVKNSYTSAK